MTREQLKFAQTDPICIAFANGKTIQCLYNWVEWRDLTALHDWIYTLGKSNTCRIKPEHKLRPWRPEEVPVGASIRQNIYLNLPSLILCVNSRHVSVAWFSPVTREISFTDLVIDKWEHSLDHGKTWHPCGVLE